MTLLKSCWQLLPPRLSILIYHRLLAKPDPLRPGLLHAAQFERQLGWLREVAQVMPLPEAVDALYARRLPPRAVAITFDDGYLEDYQVARPLLEKFGLDATFFVTTAYLQQGALWTDLIIEAIRAWPDQRLTTAHSGLAQDLPTTDLTQRAQAAWLICRNIKYWPSGQRQQFAEQLAERAGIAAPQLMMSPEQVRKLSRTMDVGGHTHSHPILTSLPLADAWQEIELNRRILISLSERPVQSFAYPNGGWPQDFGESHCEQVRQAGYRFAVSTNWGVNADTTDPFRLLRFTPWDSSRFRFQLRLLLNYGYHQ